MRLGRKKTGIATGAAAAATPVTSPGKNVLSPRQTELEAPFQLALGDLKDGPEKVSLLFFVPGRLCFPSSRGAIASTHPVAQETVLCIWAELQKSIARTKAENAQHRDLYEAESTKRSQLELQLQEVRAQLQRDARMLEAYKRETKKLFDAAVGLVGGEEAASRLRRKYEDVQEAVFAAAQEEDGLLKMSGKLLKSSAVSEAPKPQKVSGKVKKLRQGHEACVKLVNATLNPRLTLVPVEFCDPRQNHQRVYMTGELTDVEHVLTAEQRKHHEVVISSPRLTRPGKGAATLRGEINKSMLADLAAGAGMAEDDPEHDEEEEEEPRQAPPPKRSEAVPAAAAVASPVPVNVSSSAPPLRRFASMQSGLTANLSDDESGGTAGQAVDAFSQLQARKSRTRGAHAMMRPRTNSLVEQYEEGYEARLETMLRALKSKSGGRNQHIVTELLATEEDYLHDLNVMLSVYGKALKAVTSEDDFKRVFSNLEHVHAVHILLLADLKSESFRPQEEQDWGAPFIKHATKLRAVYDVYTAGQVEGRKARAAMEQSNKEAAEVLAQLLEKPEVRNLDLKVRL
jgi:hypothetical protein